MRSVERRMLRDVVICLRSESHRLEDHPRVVWDAQCSVAHVHKCAVFNGDWHILQKERTMVHGTGTLLTTVSISFSGYLFHSSFIHLKLTWRRDWWWNGGGEGWVRYAQSAVMHRHDFSFLLLGHDILKHTLHHSHVYRHFCIDKCRWCRWSVSNPSEFTILPYNDCLHHRCTSITAAHKQRLGRENDIHKADRFEGECGWTECNERDT